MPKTIAITMDLYSHVTTTLGREAAQTLAVAARLDAMRQPRILVGDMNVQPPSEELAPLLDRLCDVWPSAGRSDGPTIPSGEPRWRIDLVLVERTMGPLRAWTVRTDASDHLPVVCDVEINPAHLGPRGGRGGGRSE